MKELRVILKVRNNLLIERREASGLSAKELAEAIGISYGRYLEFESLRASPWHRGSFVPTAKKIAAYFGVSPEEIWPPGVLAVKHPSAERRLDAEEAFALLAATEEPPLLPDHYCEQNEQRRILHAAIARLGSRERFILESRLAGKSLLEIAKALKRTRARVQAIQARAIRRIQRWIERRHKIYIDVSACNSALVQPREGEP